MTFASQKVQALESELANMRVDYSGMAEQMRADFNMKCLVALTSFQPPLPLWLSAKRRAIRAIKTERWIPCQNTRWEILRTALKFNITRHI